MLTIWPAYAAFEENLRGSIEVRKLADLTVLSADIMRIPELDILKTHCVMTVIGGEIVYQAAPARRRSRRISVNCRQPNFGGRAAQMMIEAILGRYHSSGHSRRRSYETQ